MTTTSGQQTGEKNHKIGPNGFAADISPDAPTTATPPAPDIKTAQRRHKFDLSEVPVSLVGETGGWFTISKRGESITITPARPLPRRCTIRPVAIFESELGFIEANTIMGRLVFANGATDPQTYTPFTLDSRRKLRELLLPIEPMPEDDLPQSIVRVKNCQAITRRLLDMVDIPWTGLTPQDLEQIPRFVQRHEPLDGCALHALAAHTSGLGTCTIEIGSYRGSSASCTSMGLRAAESDHLLVSVDPHTDMPFNKEQVRLALREIGQEHRLVQIPTISNRAPSILRPQCASLIFIDGDHTYDQVIADFENYLDLLAPGGILAFHDYCCADHHGQPEQEPGVRRAVDEKVLGHSALKPLLLAQRLMCFRKTG